ncbi:Protein-export membrane protein SecG [Candidatus Erwinia haradaeae]|uniref:Protein-export membrane protein SecG n=1 Tax=Candidatus Erwinia haradaeae TaxID=1922217 RepID=A0A451DL37_9GAMM|nr:preprotein translocase subunit SecG [Candidatus Erwinia haradaeae]VFP87373.1 Protein-export membrane protein SecG [Candidatus Erwinia haradaeae]
MYDALLIIYLVIAISLVSLILIQQSHGHAMWSSFDAGASHTLFGSHGSNNFITRRIIPILAVLFFFLSLIFGNINSRKTRTTDQFIGFPKSEASPLVNGPVKKNVVKS